MTKKETTPNIGTGIIKALSTGDLKALNYKQIAAKMNIYDKAGREHVKKVLQELVDGNIVKHAGRGKYKMNAKYLTKEVTGKSYMTGRLSVTASGMAFVLPENRKDNSGDLFIADANLLNALHGDLVKVLIFPVRKNRRPEGQVVEVLERNKKLWVGVMQISKGIAYFVADSPSFRKNVLIPGRLLNHAKNGDKVVVEVTEWEKHMRSPLGKVVNVLGKPGENDVEMQAILVENDFPLSFPKEVEDAANQIDRTISAAEIKQRRDFRKITTFTIDPADAKDFDDALSYEKLANGLHRIGVHIADVSHYVRPGSAIDREAYARATSIYLVDRVIPMLPEALSNDICSLRPREDKLCYAALFDLDDNAKIHHEWFGRTVINSDFRFCYEEVQQTIESGSGTLSDVILPIHKLAQTLRKQRMENNAINFETEQVKFELDENGKPIGVILKENKEANHLIEEFMLLANKRVAERIGKKTSPRKEIKPFVYRIHDEPVTDKLETFKTFAKKLGYDIKTGSRKALVSSFNKMFEQTREKGEYNMINQLTIRLMARAVYSTENIGHYGLAFPFYTHFTSPIRRYPDLIVHRLLDDYLHGKAAANQNDLEEQCKHSSQMEQKAAEAERNSIKYKQAEFLSERIGQEFTATITGIAKWGVFAEINDSKCEGLIPMRNFDDDFYYIDEDNYTLVGLHSGASYRIGDQIQIRVVDVNIMKKQMNFELA